MDLQDFKFNLRLSCDGERKYIESNYERRRQMAQKFGNGKQAAPFGAPRNKAGPVVWASFPCNASRVAAGLGRRAQFLFALEPASSSKTDRGYWTPLVEST